VGHCDHEDYRGHALLVVVGGGSVPHLVGHRVRPVGQPGGGLGQRQRGPLGVTEIRRFPPGRDRGQALLGLPPLRADRAPESTQALHPLIWLARRCTSSSVAGSTPPAYTALNSAWNGSIAPRTIAGLV